MRSTYQRLIILIMILLVLVSPALANIATALAMQAGLTFYNFFVAILEAVIAFVILRCIFRMRSRLIGWLLVANYVSLFAGFMIMPTVFDRFGIRYLGAHPLTRLPDLMAAMFLFAFVLTVLIEWPFVHLGIARWAQTIENADMRWADRLPAISFITNLTVQVVSYTALFCLYLSSSEPALLKGVKIEQSLDFVKTSQAVVYYKRLDEKGYNKVRLDGSRPESVTLTKSAFDQQVADYYGNALPRKEFFGPALDLRPFTTRQIRVLEEAWGRLFIQQNGKVTRFELEGAYFHWFTGNATVLPGDQMVFETGRCIVVYDMKTRQLFELAPGYYPVVFIHGLKYPKTD